MKTNNLKALKLVEKGLSAKTVSKLTESQIDILHSRLIGESKKETKEEIKKTVTNVTYDPSNPADQQKLAQIGVHVDPTSKKITTSQTAGGITTEEEMDEDVEVTSDPNKETETQNAKQVGPSSDDGFGNEDDGMGMMEEKKGEPNPWAICHAQVGPKKTRKFERCVQSVKKQLKEGKNPVSLFIESKIMNIVERNLPPKITKGDLMKYLSEDTKEAPVKEPKTKPGTKTPPKPRPSHPGKNPNPNEREAPKARKISPEKAKEEVMDLIMNILQN